MLFRQIGDEQDVGSSAVQEDCCAILLQVSPDWFLWSNEEKEVPEVSGHSGGVDITASCFEVSPRFKKRG